MLRVRTLKHNEPIPPELERASMFGARLDRRWVWVAESCESPQARRGKLAGALIGAPMHDRLAVLRLVSMNGDRMVAVKLLLAARAEARRRGLANMWTFLWAEKPAEARLIKMMRGRRDFDVSRILPMVLVTEHLR